MTRQESIPTVPALPAVVICGNCGIEERRLLHHVRHRGIFLRLCTTCVLRLHPQNFCPTCFLVYERSPPPNSISCFKCYSSSHPNCIPTPTPSKTNYICPSCINPNIPIFSLKKVKDDFSETENCRAFDKRAAKIFLASARLAAISMNKAAVMARAEAERRAREAVMTKKRAREALENILYFMAKEKKKNHKAGNIINGSLPFQSIVNGGGGGGGCAMDRVDSSSEVLAALNAVELKEKERSKVPEVEVVSNSVVMEVDDNERSVVPPACNGNENGNSVNLDKNENIGTGKLSNPLLSVPIEVDPLKSDKSSNPAEEKNGF